MVDISRPVNRTVKTDIAGSVDVTPSGGSTGKAIVAADLVDGFNKKTISFAAGDSVKLASFPVVDDAEFEGTETYRLTFSNPQPSGAFPDGTFVEGTVGDNEADPGSGAAGKTFGPQDVNSPPAWDTEKTANYSEFTFTPGSQLVDLEVGGITSSMADCIRLNMTDDTIFQLQRVRGGSATPIVANVGIQPTNGQKIRLRQNADRSVDLLVDGVGKSGAPAVDAWPSADGKTPGTFGRVNVTFSNGGAVTKGVTIGPIA